MKRITIGRTLAIAAVGAMALSQLPVAQAKTHKPKPSHHHYVVKSMTLGVTQDEARALGFDLDGDKQPDNKLGQFLTALSTQGFDFNGPIQAGIKGGNPVTLLSLTSTSLKTAKTASLKVFQGVPHISPVLSGGGHFTVDKAAKASSKISGKIKAKAFTGAGTAAPLQLSLVPADPALVLPLVDAHVAATCTATHCKSGRIGGAITQKTFNKVLVPGFAKQLNSLLLPDCTMATPEGCSPSQNEILGIFDADHNYVISNTEVRTNNIVVAGTAPDLDLFKKNGKPGHDGVNDSLSFAVGFTAASASFKAPGE